MTDGLRGQDGVVRWIAGFAAVLVLAAGCGGGGGGAGGGGDLEVLRYFPPDAALAAVISTDVESDQFEHLDALARRQFGFAVESWLTEIARDLEISYEDDLKPMLGHEFAATFLGEDLTLGFENLLIAFRSADEKKLRDVVERQGAQPSGEVDGADLFTFPGGEITLALDGDVLLYGGRRELVEAALARADGDDNLAGRFDEALADLPRDAFVRLFADAARAVAITENEDALRLRELPWFAALETATAAVTFGEEEVTFDFALNTPDGVEESDLPLATGGEAPEILEREGGEATGGNRNQSFTTAFLFRAAELAFADSRFVRDVHALEEELGIDFVEEVLYQFDGPSASSVSLDGQVFAARSEVSDPERLRELLPRLAPHLPRLVTGLEGLRPEGQALLFVFAPDVLVLQADRVRVTEEGDLWRVTGLTGDGPDELWFGVLGDVFVVASTEELARQVAEEDTVEVDGAQGAGVMRVDVSQAAADVLDELELDEFGRIGEVVAWLEAAEERLRGQLRVELPG